MPQHYGIDESTNNVHPFDWAAVYADLKQRGGGAQPFVIVKIEQGTAYTNPDLQADLAAARAAGFAVAGYLMDQGNAAVAAEEALYRRLVGALPQADDDELPEGLSAVEYAAHCAALVSQNPVALVYLNDSEVEEGFQVGAGLWLAEPNGQPGVVSHPCLMHQFSWTGAVSGIQGAVDLNVWLGTEEQFAAFFGGIPSYLSALIGGTGMGTFSVAARPEELCPAGESIDDMLCVLDGTVYEVADAPYWQAAGQAVPINAQITVPHPDTGAPVPMVCEIEIGWTTQKDALRAIAKVPNADLKTAKLFVNACPATKLGPSGWGEWNGPLPFDVAL